MTIFEIFLLIFGAALLYLLVKAARAVLRFKRSFDDFSVEAGERLMRHAEQVDSTLERWHEYDEAYQEAVARLEEEGAGPHRADRGATLGPTGGGSFRKPDSGKPN